MAAPMSLVSFKIKLAAVLLTFASGTAVANIGSVTEHHGPPAQLERDKTKLSASQGTGVQMDDVISTANSKIKLTFDDNTDVSLTEQSRLVIDDFVYDPGSGTGRLAATVAMGTVRYTSGAVAKNSRENVRLRTPTATISVRGTDFTMTVDEIGRSLVILLPSCPDDAKDEAECFVGEIMVENAAGQVLLNQAYQATVVNSRSAAPSQPRIIDLDGRVINNELIITPPRDTSGAYIQQAGADNENMLNTDLLEFEDLGVDYLNEQLLVYAELDIEFLGVGFLENYFTLIGNELDADALELDPVLPGIKQHSWVQYAYNEQDIFVRSEQPPHIAEVSNRRDTYGEATIIQDGLRADWSYNDGGDVVINITQTQ